MTWQTRSSLTPKVLSENQWQLHWLSMETEFTHFHQAMQLYRRVRKKKNTRGKGTVLNNIDNDKLFIMIKRWKLTGKRWKLSNDIQFNLNCVIYKPVKKYQLNLNFILMTITNILLWCTLLLSLTWKDVSGFGSWWWTPLFTRQNEFHIKIYYRDCQLWNYIVFCSQTLYFPTRSCQNLPECQAFIHQYILSE